MTLHIKPHPVECQFDAWVALVVLLHPMLHQGLHPLHVKRGLVQVCLQVLLTHTPARAQVAKNVAGRHQPTVLLHQVAEDRLLWVTQQVDLEARALVINQPAKGNVQVK